MKIANANINDIYNMHNVQIDSYNKDLIENIDLFEFIVGLGHSLCLFENKKMIGYVLVHFVSASGRVPKLGDIADIIDYETKDLFIHDICILPEHRSKGYGSVVIRKIIADYMNKVEKVHIVALAPAVNFWKKQGFITSVQNVDKSYKNAVGMVRCISV